MATYEMMKRTIIRQKASGALNRSDWQSKLDVFMLFDRITPEQYTELKELIEDSAAAMDTKVCKTADCKRREVALLGQFPFCFGVLYEKR